jgi:hypothetical protein
MSQMVHSCRRPCFFVDGDHSSSANQVKNNRLREAPLMFGLAAFHRTRSGLGGAQAALPTMTSVFASFMVVTLPTAQS